MQNIEEKLRDIGLSEKESLVYAALLKSGRGTAYSVAQKAGVKTPTTYVILDNLIKKNLVLKIPYSKSQVFIAKMPDAYIHAQQDKLRSFEEILPQLRSFCTQSKQSKTITFDGYDGILDALNYSIDTLKNKRLFAFYSHLPDVDPKILEIYLKWNDVARKRGIVHYVIAPNTEESLSFIKPQEKIYKGHTKLIPPKLWSPETSIEIVGEEFVRIISSKDLQATIIDNNRVAKAMKQIFDMVWNSPIGKDYG